MSAGEQGSDKGAERHRTRDAQTGSGTLHAQSECKWACCECSDWTIGVCSTEYARHPWAMMMNNVEQAMSRRQEVESIHD